MRPIIYSILIIGALIFAKFFLFSDGKKEGEKKVSPGGEKKPGPGQDIKPIKVKYIVLKSEVLGTDILTTGSINPNEEVEVRPEISGKIVKLFVPEGGMVSKGFLLAKIKDDDILAQLKKLEIEEKLAAQIEARQKRLLEINAISKEEFEISQNKVSTLKADKEILQVSLSRTEIRAPFSGKTSLKNISLGAYVTPATVITKISQFNPIKIDFSLPERYINNLNVGKNIIFTTESSVAEYNAKIIALESKVDENLRTLKVRAQTPNTSQKLVPGMYVKVKLNVNNENSILVPNETVIPVSGGKKVFIIKNGKAEEIMIEALKRDNKSIQVSKGLQTGDSLIISGILTLKKGSPVSPMK